MTMGLKVFGYLTVKYYLCSGNYKRSAFSKCWGELISNFKKASAQYAADKFCKNKAGIS